MSEMTCDDYKPGMRVVARLGAVTHRGVVHEDTGWCDEVSPYHVLVTIQGGKRDGYVFGVRADCLRLEP
jgi:hypothetical protein